MVRRKIALNGVPTGPADPPRDDVAAPEPFWIYALEMSVRKPLSPVQPDYDYADLYDGTIVRRSVDRDPEPAGRFIAIRMRIEDAHADGIAARSIFDAFDGRLDVFWKALFDPELDDIDDMVRLRFDVGGSDVLLVYGISLLPEHRGRDVGLATAARLIDTLGLGCDLVAMRPLPAQICRPIADAEFHAAMRLEYFPPDADAAYRRLRRHFGRLGFRRVRRTSIYALRPDERRLGLASFTSTAAKLRPA